MATDIARLLRQTGMEILIDRFQEEKIEITTISSISDNELMRLGVMTIGDRIRLKEAAKQVSRGEEEIAGPSFEQSVAPSIGPVRQILGERNRLFGRRPIKTKQKGKKTRFSGWTGQFVCLSSKTCQKIPTTSEKEILRKAGLGLKKIRMENDNEEAAVLDNIMWDLINEGGETVGFPQLKDAGGVELLRTVQNCRSLCIIDCPWTSKELKCNVGSQAKIYVRPIQKNLETKSLETDEKEHSQQVKTVCEGCKVEFYMRELREHLALCPSESLPDIHVEPDDLYLPEFSVNNSRTEEVNIDDIDSTLTAIVNGTIGTISFQDDSTETSATETINTAEQFPIYETPTIEQLVEKVINLCKENNVDNPVEILKLMQQEIVTGRPLVIENTSESAEGDTNFIMVDRENILTTGFEELFGIQKNELGKTLEVQFYNETALDYGGPRKEFFRLVLREIKSKYFDNHLRDLLVEDYEMVGIVFALSTLQNGKVPNFMDENMLEELWDSQSPSPCIKRLRQGLNHLGLFEVCRQLPSFRYIFHHHSVQLTVKRVLSLLKPNFSEKGSNMYLLEKTVYNMFIKYIREVASGRRDLVTLSKVLEFVTGTDEEPLLGFKLHPSIEFQESVSSYLPTANTCINLLKLPRTCVTGTLPEEVKLFALYDYSFTNTYYGLK